MATITEEVLEAFEKMTVESLVEQAKKLGLKTDGDKNELIARLAAQGYNPLATAQKAVFPVLFMNVKTCEPVLKVVESIKAKKFLRMRLPRIDRFGRLQRGFYHHAIPCRPETAKSLLNSDLVSTYEQFDMTLDEVKKNPDEWNFTWCQVRGKDVNTGNPRYFVALHAQRKDLDVQSALEEQTPQAV